MRAVLKVGLRTARVSAKLLGQETVPDDLVPHNAVPEFAKNSMAQLCTARWCRSGLIASSHIGSQPKTVPTVVLHKAYVKAYVTLDECNAVWCHLVT